MAERPPSSTEFVRSVRAKMNAQLATDSHHPGERYSPLAFRHFIRRRKLLEALSDVSFATGLDVGCSEGFFMHAIAERLGAEVWGVDISDLAARRLVERYGYHAGAADAIRLPFADGSFDLVYSTETIEDVLDPERMLAEMRRVARRLVLVTTPVSQPGAHVAPDYELREEGHVQSFDRDTVRRLFGPDARLDSFRCNASLALIVAGGRYLPGGLRDAFYGFDQELSRRVGSPEHRFAALRNRDWLITLPVQTPAGTPGAGAPEWRCPRCHGELAEQPGALRCPRCALAYPVTPPGPQAPAGAQAVPDFVEAPAGAGPGAPE